MWLRLYFCYDLIVFMKIKKMLDDKKHCECFDYKEVSNAMKTVHGYEIRFKKDIWSVLIFDFVKTGHLDFFSGLISDSSWSGDFINHTTGVMSDKFKFTLHLWKELGMEKIYGELNPSIVIVKHGRVPCVFRYELDKAMEKISGVAQEVEIK